MTQDQVLTVAARFGDVLIVEPEALNIVALAYEAPVVEHKRRSLDLSLLPHYNLRLL